MPSLFWHLYEESLREGKPNLYRQLEASGELTSHLDEVAKAYEGKLTIAKLDIDANPSTPGKFGIRGIPTVILYKGGQVHAQKVGALTISQLTAFLDSHL